MKKTFLLLVMVGSLSAEPFSFAAVENLQTPCSAPKYFETSDGIKLAYRSYGRTDADTVFLLIPGGGAHSCAGYQVLSKSLADAGVAVHTLDLRGHGLSDGKRGATPSVERVYADITEAILLLRKKNQRLILAGHSSGAGLLLNYSSWSRAVKPDRYLFLAPEFGFRSHTEKKTDEPFAETRLSVFLGHTFSGGHFFADTIAVRLHYPGWVTKLDPLLLTGLCTTMALALTPEAPLPQLKGIARNTTILVGQDDEVIDAMKLQGFAEEAGVSTLILPRTTHLSILFLTDRILEAVLQ